MIRLLSYITTLFVFALLSACGGGGGSPGTTSSSTSFFTTAPSDLTIGIGSSQQYDVGGGRSPYTAVSSNAAVLVVAASGGKLTLGGVAPGSAKVTVRDGAGATQAITVTVAPNQALATSAPASGLVLQVGSSAAQTYSISGGVGPYSVTSTNPTVLTATVSGNALTLTGLSAGSASVVLRDNVNTTVTVPVAVSAAAGAALFTTAPSSITLARGTTGSYGIGGGLAPYTAVSSNTSVASVSANGSQLTVSALANGTASVVVRDAGNNTATISVTVSSAPITLNPTSYTAFIGDTVYSVISGGAAPYSAISGFPDVAEVAVGTLSNGAFTADSAGNVVRVRVKQAASSANIIVTDANGSSSNLTLTSSASTNAINLTPASLSISECYKSSIQLILYGASGSTNVFSSDTTLLTIGTTPVTGSSTGTAVTVNRTNNPVTADTSVIVTAVDATGAVGTSTVKIVDSSTVCP